MVKNGPKGILGKNNESSDSYGFKFYKDSVDFIVKKIWADYQIPRYEQYNVPLEQWPTELKAIKRETPNKTAADNNIIF